MLMRMGCMKLYSELHVDRRYAQSPDYINEPKAIVLLWKSLSFVQCGPSVASQYSSLLIFSLGSKVSDSAFYCPYLHLIPRSGTWKPPPKASPEPQCPPVSLCG